jgi:hypothetical protein
MCSSRHPGHVVDALGGGFVDHAELQPHRLDAQPILLGDGLVDDRAPLRLDPPGPGMPSSVAKRVIKSIRNREARVTEPDVA